MTPIIRFAGHSLLCALLCSWPSAAALAEAYIPARDNLVLDIVPARKSNPLDARIARLQGQLAAQPQVFARASELAQAHLERFRRDGDPRDLGQADALITPWLQTRPIAPLALLLRASIRQSNHQFDLALADLDTVMRASPGNTEALLMRASILQVQARYADARESCGGLVMQDAVIAGVCLANVLVVSGQPQQGVALLQRLAPQAPDSHGVSAWVWASLGEAASWRGNTQLAEQALRAGRKVSPDDAYLKTAWADYLLSQHRGAEVQKLLADDTRNDNLLLRLAMAEQQTRDDALAGHIADLNARFAAAAARGDRVHLREEAMFRLYLLKQPEAALKLAQANWQVQKETADARILLASARAARQPAAASPALQWFKQAGLPA
ncbi:tetratricopeptide repeat protein [Amantichitinum ursilacus]|uniref:Tetratricopeptide repeat protein n=1 Tax=Amantichitinum ursilacus TaxID=857265 RepID=A0A0N0XGW7_9NEIS|nr:hypothetical protein [Amantichitinum ursilacus]KPC50561.1 hypothetical protein WG78_17190 [Amantichitinum ursilacus]